MKKQTLPTWARDWPHSVDIARREIRRRPDLQRLGETFGATRVYSESEAALILAALNERAGVKQPAAVG